MDRKIRQVKTLNTFQLYIDRLPINTWVLSVYIYAARTDAYYGTDGRINEWILIGWTDMVKVDRKNV